jgi:25S rRNA (uracil2634-N3)-methyltransferase
VDDSQAVHFANFFGALSAEKDNVGNVGKGTKKKRRVIANPNPRWIGPYCDRQNILVVGDGDLSFSLSLVLATGGSNVTATTFDTRSELFEKYASAPSTVRSLRQAGATVLHGIDATRLDEFDWEGEKFDRIVFNFPHIGGATKEDLLLNQALLREFFSSSTELLNGPVAEVHVSLRTTMFYNSWDVTKQGMAAGYKLHKTKPFRADLFLRYENQRTKGDHQGHLVREAPSTEGAKTYCFRANPEED